MYLCAKLKTIMTQEEDIKNAVKVLRDGGVIL